MLSFYFQIVAVHVGRVDRVLPATFESWLAQSRKRSGSFALLADWGCAAHDPAKSTGVSVDTARITKH